MDIHSFIQQTRIQAPAIPGDCVREGGSTKGSWCKSSWRACGHQAGFPATSVSLLFPDPNNPTLHAHFGRQGALCSKSFVGTSHGSIWAPLSSSVKGLGPQRSLMGLPGPKYSPNTHRPCPVRRDRVPQCCHGCWGGWGPEAANPMLLGFTHTVNLGHLPRCSVSLLPCCLSLPFLLHFSSFLFQTSKLDLKWICVPGIHLLAYLSWLFIGQAGEVRGACFLSGSLWQ